MTTACFKMLVALAVFAAAAFLSADVVSRSRAQPVAGSAADEFFPRANGAGGIVVPPAPPVSTPSVSHWSVVVNPQRFAMRARSDYTHIYSFVSVAADRVHSGNVMPGGTVNHYECEQPRFEPQRRVNCELALADPANDFYQICQSLMFFAEDPEPRDSWYVWTPIRCARLVYDQPGLPRDPIPNAVTGVWTTDSGAFRRAYIGGGGLNAQDLAWGYELR